MLNTIGWLTIRVLVTLACVWTIQNIIYRDGYHVEFKTLIVAAIVIIVGVRMWMPGKT